MASQGRPHEKATQGGGISGKGSIRQGKRNGVISKKNGPTSLISVLKTESMAEVQGIKLCQCLKRIPRTIRWNKRNDIDGFLIYQTFEDVGGSRAQIFNNASSFLRGPSLDGGCGFSRAQTLEDVAKVLSPRATFREIALEQEVQADFVQPGEKIPVGPTV
ncbi:hypothetical protein CsatA_003836 [Cannabis sativa]